MMAFTTHAQPLTFTTFAGPPGGVGCTDGTGSAAQFDFPTGVATDRAGNVYVADSQNHTIRKVSPSGVVTTLAGLKKAYGRQDGSGSAARFFYPEAVATDIHGNVYVAERNNYAIRKITPKGVVTTLAGSASEKGSADGNGSSARFLSPSGLATDSRGNVYVADLENRTLRRITAEGVVTTIAGSAGQKGSADGSGSSARFDSPMAVATDTAGNVYVADNGNHTIRKVTPAGAVTTLAGSTGLHGSADGTGNAARFSGPVGVATDSAGNVYVADTDTIRKVTPAAVVTTLAGTFGASGSTNGTGSAARFRSAHGVTTDSGGNIYVAEPNAVRKITPAGVVTTLAGAVGGGRGANGSGCAATFAYPRAITTDGAGNVYVADERNNMIRKISPAGVASTMAGSAGGAGSTDGTGTDARFNSPSGLAIDRGGNLYVADTGNGSIRKITPAGVVTTLAGSAEAGSADDTRFNAPQGVAVDSGRNVYVADTDNHTIRKISPAGVVTTLAGSREKGSADGKGTDARFSSPHGLAIDASGNLYVADTENDAIRKITPAGVVTTFAGSSEKRGIADGTGSDASFWGPRGVATDSSGNVYATDSNNHSIRKISPAGAVTTLGGSPRRSGDAEGTGRDALFRGPGGVAVDSGGNIYVADTGNDKIRIGRLGLADAATIDSSTGTVGTARQLAASPQTASTWQWTLIRMPSASAARLSSTSIPNPRFTPDVADLYIFQVTASKGEKTSITTVSLTATATTRVKP